MAFPGSPTSAPAPGPGADGGTPPATAIAGAAPPAFAAVLDRVLGGSAPADVGAQDVAPGDALARLRAAARLVPLTAGMPAFVFAAFTGAESSAATSLAGTGAGDHDLQQALLAAGSYPTGDADAANPGLVPLASLAEAAPLRGLSLNGVSLDSISVTLAAAPAGADSPTSPAPLITTSPSDVAPVPATAANAVPPPAATAAPAASTVQSSLAALQPQFRDKLETVIAQMRSQFGYQVDVRETSRTQARQDRLFAQGRTAPGPVVTWTDHSLHTLGLAADVSVANAADPALANQRLAAVAQQVGLRTLGPRDPDHIEQMRTAGMAGGSPPGAVGRSVGAPAPARVVVAPTAASVLPSGWTGVAQVARVAPVALVAAVAQVAPVAEPGMPPAAGSSDGGDDPSSRENDSARSDRNAPAPAPTVASPAQQSAATNAAAPSTTPVVPAAAPVQAPVERTSINSQIARFDAAHDAAASRPMSQVVLRMDGASGTSDTIRVGVRGATVDAVVGTGDGPLAQRLTSDLGQLRNTLESQGLNVGTLHVRADLSAVHADVAERTMTAVDRTPVSAGLAGSGGGEPQANSNRGPDGSSSNSPRRQAGNPNRRQGKNSPGETKS